MDFQNNTSQESFEQAKNLFLLGLEHYEKGSYEEAEHFLVLSSRILPNRTSTLTNLSAVLIKLEKFEKAHEIIVKAITLNPTDETLYLNQGNLFAKQKKDWPMALASYEKAIELKPTHAEAYNNRGSALKELKRLNEALQSYEKAIDIKSDYASAHLNKSHVLLLIGDLKEGFLEYEWRWKDKEGSEISGKREFIQPLWLGNESLVGKTILLWSEQGLGDSIQFCRYAKLVKALGARVLIDVPKPLSTLLTGLEGVDFLIEKGKPLPEFDFHCPMMSLPLAFKTDFHSIPSSSPYLKSNVEKVEEWRRRLGGKSKPRIGLVWSGSTTHTNDQARSLKIAELIKYLPPDFEFVSLQKEVREVDQQPLHSSSIKHFGEKIIDFSDTAALCELMDLVISVDTSVAHVAGALGKVTWILLPYIPDWRWLLDTDVSPWYESVKLYRKSDTGDYSQVLDRVAKDLRDFF